MSNKLTQFLNQYDVKVNLPSINRDVSIKPITTGQMKRYLAYENADDPFVVEEILDDIVNSSVIEEDFVLDDVSVQDRFSLLINIRKITKGDEYTFNIICPECNTDLINVIKISELDVVEYPKDVDYTVKLTDTLTAHMSPITRGMQKQAISHVNGIKGLNQDQRIIEMATYTFAISMEKFETPIGELGDVSIEDKKEFLDELDEKAYDKINELFKKYDYGVKFVYTPKCRFCEWKEKPQDIPLTSFFF